jgi:hypothetical protein
MEAARKRGRHGHRDATMILVAPGGLLCEAEESPVSPWAPNQLHLRLP